MYDQLWAGVESEDAQQGAGVECDSVHAAKPCPSVKHVDILQDSQSCARVQSVSDVKYAQPCTGAVYDQLWVGVRHIVHILVGSCSTSYPTVQGLGWGCPYVRVIVHILAKQLEHMCGAGCNTVRHIVHIMAR